MRNKRQMLSVGEALQPNVVWQHESLPMALVRYEVAAGQLGLVAAKAELEQRAINARSNTWSYDTDQQSHPANYPATVALASVFQKRVINRSPLARLPLKLAFIRRSLSSQSEVVGGLHIDVDRGTNLIADEARKDREILRLIFNLDDRAPRYVAHTELPARNLRARGIDIPHNRYKVLSSVKQCGVERAAIPALEQDAIYALGFISSRVPHVGLDTPSGNFVIAYGAYVEDKEI
jgi:hypothetical protein